MYSTDKITCDNSMLFEKKSRCAIITPLSAASQRQAVRPSECSKEQEGGGANGVQLSRNTQSLRNIFLPRLHSRQKHKKITAPRPKDAVILN